jgi:hypothetical protein
MYYAIVEKETGIMQYGHSNYIDHQDRPLHESLAYVPLSDELVKLLISDDPEDHLDLTPVDFTVSYWDFKKSKWVLIDSTILDAPDPILHCISLRQQLVNDATRKLNIPDIPDKVKKKLTDYIDEISAVSVTADTVQSIVWPEVPI